ncbi:MAG: 2-hydroxychromene-2-carboxylate isomerase [Acidiferrobacterales bacterium]|nr:2-hydroxychromene-2-carboxylate isomerase [Acidiferrobacterales bacterium]
MSSSDHKSVRWYYDFISPFAYLQFCRLQSEVVKRDDLVIEYTPVLFAGLLNHFGQKGPAEIPAKRQMTYRYCHWYAEKHDIPFQAPAAHPFNPLPMLRLALAHRNTPQVIAQLFHHVWVDSADDASFSSLETLETLPGFKNAAKLITEPAVKEQLKTNTEGAIQKGIFGVPTIEVESELFWGLDMTEMALTYLQQREQLDTKEYRRLGDLPVAKAR